MKKLLLSIVACFIAVATLQAEKVTLSFADKANRTTFTTSQQIWEQNGIVLTNNKGASTSNVADYAKPARFYKNSKIIIECSLGNIVSIEFDCNSSSYATSLSKSIGSASVNQDKVTVTLDGTSNSFTIEKLSDGQVRMDALTVNYEDENSTEPEPVSLALEEESAIQTEYYVSESFNLTGLVATATLEDGTTEEVTDNVTWSYNPAELTLDTESVEVTATYKGVSASKTYEVTMKTIANTPETAYTVEEAVALIDANRGLGVEVYVKGIVSKVESFNSNYGSITYWISTDGTEESQQFECYSGLNIGGKKFTSKDDLSVGTSVVVVGTMKKYGKVYEFNYNNKIVSMETTGINDILSEASLKDGKFIENGRLVIVKAGKKFNAAGQLQK